MMGEMGHESRSFAWVERLPGVLLVASLLLLLHRYQGIWHDSVLYLGQALAVLYPGSFRDDIFFAYGSQASYTLMPKVLAWLISAFGIGDLFLWLTLLGLVAFVVASFCFLCQLLPVRWRLPGLLALLLLPGTYSVRATLGYAESFLTGRTFAEPIILFGLAALITGRRWLACCLWIAAAILHPLQALPALVIGWAWLVVGGRRWLHLLWLVLPFLCALVLVPSLRVLIVQMDSVWYEQVYLRNSITLYFSNGATSWYNLLLDGFVVFVATGIAQGRLRRYLQALLIAIVLLDVSSLVLADILHMAWPAGLQFWRVHWIGHWTVVALLPWLVFSHWRHEGVERGLLLIAVVLLGLMPDLAHPIMPGVMLLYLLWPWLRRYLGNASSAVLLAIVLIFSLAHAFEALHVPIVVSGLVDRLFGVDVALTSAQIAAVVIALPLVLGHRSGVVWNRLLIVVLLPVLLVSVIHWDARSPLQRALTADQERGVPFDGQISPDAQVIWLHSLLPVWALLHRADYMDQHQMAGLVFNRGTAVEGLRRKDLLHVQNANGESCRLVVYPMEDHPQCRPDAAAVRQACIRSEGGLSYVVLPYKLSAPERGRWPENGSNVGTHYLYSCLDFM